jgi:cofilin
MSVSGVTIEDDCIRSFNDMKLKHDKRYLIYRINEEQTRIVIEEVGEKTKTYEEFKQSLFAKDGPRYAVVDFEYRKADTGQIQDKLVFVFWCPDTSKIKLKMIYASSKDSLTKPLNGIAKVIQANDADDVDEKEIQAQLARV